MAAEPQNENHRTIRFGVFDADLRTQELRRQGTRLKLPRQSFQILQMLLERSGELVTREELQNVLWPGDTFRGLRSRTEQCREADSGRPGRFSGNSALYRDIAADGIPVHRPDCQQWNGTATARGTNGAAVAERETRVANEWGLTLVSAPDGAVPGRLRWLDLSFSWRAGAGCFRGGAMRASCLL